MSTGLRIDLSSVPEPVLRVMEILEEHGYRAYLVGGCVRDLLLGKKPHDYDIATSAKPLDVMRILEKHGLKVIPIGLEFGTVKVVVPGWENVDIEVTTFRKELYPEYGRGGRRPVVSFTDRLEEDVSRRDFTINALAVDVHGNVVDLVGGLRDLENKVIRFVGNPVERILEDPLRLLRALRFASTLGFSLSPETFEAVKKHRRHIRRVSWERIRDEILKTIEKRKLSNLLDLMYRTGLLEEIIPELTSLTFHEIREIINALSRLEKLGIPEISIYLAVTLHPFRKNGKLVEHILRRLKLPVSVIKKVLKIHELSDKAKETVEESPKVHRVIVEILPEIEGNTQLLQDLLHYVHAVTGWEKPLRFLKELEEEAKTMELRPIVTGEDIMKMLRLRPSPEIGKLKKHAYRIQLEKKLRKKEEILKELVKKLLYS